ncbi:MAG: hypothetical protein KGO53_09790 [Alphaproteobacteria bacterium]|nr:hypothetical protein [Alphaproteobacteria bacterium]
MHPRLWWLALLVFAPPACAQPPVELVGQPELACAAPGAGESGCATQRTAPSGQDINAPPNGFAKLEILPAQGDERGEGFYVFGVAPLAGAAPYLAFAPAGGLSEARSWEFFTGRGLSGSVNWVSYGRWQSHGADGAPWSPGKRAALFAADEPAGSCTGYDVDWSLGLRRWLVLYSCGSEVRVRVAGAPWGPWSDATVIASGAGGTGAVLMAEESPPQPAASAWRLTTLYWQGVAGADGSRPVFRATLRQEGGD